MAHGSAAPWPFPAPRAGRDHDCRRSAGAARFLRALRHSRPGDAGAGCAAATPGRYRALPLGAQPHVCGRAVLDLRTGTALRQRWTSRIRHSRLARVLRFRASL